MWSLVPNDGRTPLGDRVVAYARGTTICPDIKSVETFGSKTCKGKNKNEKILNSATGRLKDLPKRYEALNYAIKNLLGVEKKDIVIAGYTNPLLNAHGEYCSNPANIADNKNEWGLARLIIPTETIAPVWDLNLTYKEVKEVDTYVVQNLNNTILNSSKNLEWQYVDVDNVMKNHGWCVDGNTNHARLMYLPKDVYKWNGYEDHKRMIRTGNDSVLTQFRSSNYPDFIGGILHPNVQGYAEMADAILATVVH